MKPSFFGKNFKSSKTSNTLPRATTITATKLATWLLVAFFASRAAVAQPSDSRIEPTIQKTSIKKIQQGRSKAAKSKLKVIKPKSQEAPAQTPSNNANFVFVNDATKNQTIADIATLRTVLSDHEIMLKYAKSFAKRTDNSAIQTLQDKYVAALNGGDSTFKC